MGKSVDLWVIRKNDGTILNDFGKILFFNTPADAFKYIDVVCGGSMYLNVTKWDRRKTEK
jgi:hypothetical protein